MPLTSLPTFCVVGFKFILHRPLVRCLWNRNLVISECHGPQQRPLALAHQCGTRTSLKSGRCLSLGFSLVYLGRTPNTLETANCRPGGLLFPTPSLRVCWLFSTNVLLCCFVDSFLNFKIQCQPFPPGPLFSGKSAEFGVLLLDSSTLLHRTPNPVFKAPSSCLRLPEYCPLPEGTGGPVLFSL